MLPIFDRCPKTIPTDYRLRRQAEDTTALAQLTAATRDATGPWIAGLAPWSLYLTLTYDPAKWYQQAAPPSSWASNRHLSAFYRDASNLLQRPVYVAAARESTRQGWPHWHCLMASGSIGAGEFADLHDAWYARHGYCLFERVKPNTEHVVAAYCAKYMVKTDAELLILGPWQGRQAYTQGTLSGQRLPRLPRTIERHARRD